MYVNVLIFVCFIFFLLWVLYIKAIVTSTILTTVNNTILINCPLILVYASQLAGSLILHDLSISSAHNINEIPQTSNCCSKKYFFKLFCINWNLLRYLLIFTLNIFPVTV